MDLGLGIVLIALLVSCWGLYLARLQVFPSQKKKTGTDHDGLRPRRSLDRCIRRPVRTLPGRDVGVVTVPHHGSYNLDLVPMVAGPSREWNEVWSNVLRGQEPLARFRTLTGTVNGRLQVG